VWGSSEKNLTQAIHEGIAGNFCRCSGYGKMVSAIEQAAIVLQ
jgi:aerobic-type carbon monoxide dehydrogenase small subunit (CoxS/CutS family)